MTNKYKQTKGLPQSLKGYNSNGYSLFSCGNYRKTGKNNVPLFLQIVDYYSTADKYIHSRTHSNAHQTVFTKENDKYQWLVLEQKSQCGVEIRQTDRHGTITN